MTPEETADMILSLVDVDKKLLKDGVFEAMVLEIAAQIKLAVDEAVKKDRLTYVHFIDEEHQKELDELQEPMSCGHAQAEMQPSDEGPDMCVACYLAQGVTEQARAEGFRDAIEKAADVCINLWKTAPNLKPDYKQNAISHGCIACAEAIRSLIPDSERKAL